MAPPYFALLESFFQAEEEHRAICGAGNVNYADIIAAIPDNCWETIEHDVFQQNQWDDYGWMRHFYTIQKLYLRLQKYSRRGITITNVSIDHPAMAKKELIRRVELPVLQLEAWWKHDFGKQYSYNDPYASDKQYRYEFKTGDEYAPGSPATFQGPDSAFRLMELKFGLVDPTLLIDDYANKVELSIAITDYRQAYDEYRYLRQDKWDEEEFRYWTQVVGAGIYEQMRHISEVERECDRRYWQDDERQRCQRIEYVKDRIADELDKERCRENQALAANQALTDAELERAYESYQDVGALIYNVDIWMEYPMAPGAYVDSIVA
eukprot:g817.t1